MLPVEESILPPKSLPFPVQISAVVPDLAANSHSCSVGKAYPSQEYKSPLKTQETDVEIEEQKEEIIDKEAIAKMEKQRKEEELAAIKEDVKKKLEEETKVNDAIKSANKSLNSDLTNDDTSDLESEPENEILA